MQTIKLETARLYMRELIDADAAQLFHMDSDADVQRYVGNQPLKTIEEAKDVIQFIRKQYEENGIGRWAVIRKEDKAFIGWAGLKLITKPINGRSGHYDLGYRFSREHWGKGYGSECAFASLDYALNAPVKKEVHAFVHEQNIASRKILEKIGMVAGDRFIDDGDPCIWYSLVR